MFDIEIALDSLQKIKAMLDLIIERSSVVETPHPWGAKVPDPIAPICSGLTSQ